MPILSDAELRFLLAFSLKQVPASTLNDIKSSSDKSVPAYKRAANIMADHFAKGRHEVHRPEPNERMTFNAMRTRRPE